MKKKRVLSNLFVAIRNHFLYYKNDAKLENPLEKNIFFAISSF